MLTLCRRSHSRILRRSRAEVGNGKPSSAPTACYPSPLLHSASFTANTSESFLGNFPSSYFGIFILTLNAKVFVEHSADVIWEALVVLWPENPKFFEADPVLSHYHTNLKSSSDLQKKSETLFFVSWFDC